VREPGEADDARDELDGLLARKRSMGGKRGPLRPAGIRYYQDCVRPWEPLRDTPVPALRRRQVEDHIAARAAVASTAARNELQFLKAALRTAQSRGQQVDVGMFEIDPIRVEAREGEALEYEELLGLASWPPGRVQRIVPFCGTVGLRFTEAVTLTDDRVDLEAGTIFIPSRLNKSRRPKPIPLARIEVQLLREQLLVRPPGTRVVFATEKGGVYKRGSSVEITRPITTPATTAAPATESVEAALWNVAPLVNVLSSNSTRVPSTGGAVRTLIEHMFADASDDTSVATCGGIAPGR
jgi:integrase